MQCPECGLELSGTERVCPRCLTPLARRESESPGGPAGAVDLAMGQGEGRRGTSPRSAEMTAQMRRLMEGPVWTTRKTQLALTLFLLLVALAVLVAAFASVSRRNAKYYVKRASAYDQAGQHELALASYLQALELDPDLADAENGTGWSYLELGQPSMAIPHFNNAVALDAQLVAAHQGLGAAYSAINMNLEAEASLKSALKLRPNDLPALRYLGRVYFQEQRYEEAVATLEEVTGARGDDVVALEYLGRSFYAMERYDEALNPLQAALELDPGSESVRETLALVWYELGRYDKALEHFGILRTAHPDEPAWYAYIGHSLYKEGDLASAASHLAHALSLARADPVLSTSYRYLGWIRYDEARYDEAIALFERGLIMDPLDPETMAGLGWCYVQLERCEDARPLFEDALAIDAYLEQAKQGLEVCPAEGSGE